MNKTLLKKTTIGFVILIIIVIIVGINIKNNKNQEKIEKNTQIVSNNTKKTFKKKIEKKINPNIGKIFTIDHTTEFDGYSTTSLPLFQSYETRRLVGEVKRYDKVELLDYDNRNFYCKIKKDEKNVGWLLCNWLKELPDTMKLDTNF